MKKITLILAALMATAASSSSIDKKGTNMALSAPKETLAFSNKFRFFNFKKGKNTFKAQIVNMADYPQKFKVVVKEIKKDEFKGDYTLSAKHVSQVGEEMYLVGPKGKTEVTLNVNLPEDAIGSKAFRLTYEKDEETAKKEKSVLNSDALVIFNVKDDPRHNFKVKNEISKKLGRVFVKTHIKNDGESVLYGANITLIVVKNKQRITSDKVRKEFLLPARESLEL